MWSLRAGAGDAVMRRERISLSSFLGEESQAVHQRRRYGSFSNAVTLR